MAVAEVGSSVPQNAGWNIRLPPGAFYMEPTRGGSSRGPGWFQESSLTCWPTREPGHRMRPHARSHAGVLRPSLGRERLRPGSRTQAPLSAACKGPSCSPESRATDGEHVAEAAGGSVSLPGWGERPPQKSIGWILPSPRVHSTVTEHPPCFC